MLKIRRTLCALMIASFAGPAFGGDLPKSFSVGRYIPDNVWFYVHEVHNPEREFLLNHWGGVFDALGKCGIDEEIKRLISAEMAESDRADFEAKWDRTLGAFSEVPWGKLGEVEFALGQRMAIPMPTYFFVTKNKPTEVKFIAKSLSKVLHTVASLSEELSVKKFSHKGAKVASLRLADLGALFELTYHDDLIIATLGQGTVTEVLDLVRDKEGKGSIVAHPEFRQALKSSPTAEDALFFFRWSRFIKQLQNIITVKGDSDEDVKSIKDVIFKACEEIAVVDYSIWTRKTEELSEIQAGFTKLRANCRQKALVRSLVERKAFKKFDQFVPKDATGFWVWSMIDLQLLYEGVVKFIKDEIPEHGPELIQKWEGMLEHWGFDPHREIFSWLSGEIAYVSLPGMMGSQTNMFFAVRTKDPKAAWEKISGWLDKLAARFEQVAVNPAPEVEAEGFRTVFHPMMMMMQMKPVIGMYEDWLVIGTKPQDVNRCLATAKGKAPSIRENERFKAEGLIPDGEVYSAAFSDLTHLGEEMGMAFGMMGMAGGMIPDQEDTRPVKMMFNLMARLAPVMAELDFFRSSASMSRFTGKGWESVMVTNYKPYVPEPKMEETPSGEGSQSQLSGGGTR